LLAIALVTLRPVDLGREAVRGCDQTLHELVVELLTEPERVDADSASRDVGGLPQAVVLDAVDASVREKEDLAREPITAGRVELLVGLLERVRHVGPTAAIVLDDVDATLDVGTVSGLGDALALDHLVDHALKCDEAQDVARREIVDDRLGRRAQLAHVVVPHRARDVEHHHEVRGGAKVLARSAQRVRGVDLEQRLELGLDVGRRYVRLIQDVLEQNLLGHDALLGHQTAVHAPFGDIRGLVVVVVNAETPKGRSRAVSTASERRRIRALHRGQRVDDASLAPRWRRCKRRSSSRSARAQECTCAKPQRTRRRLAGVMLPVVVALSTCRARNLEMTA